MALFKSKTFESITAGLQKTVADLATYADEQVAAREAANVEAERQRMLSATADAEAAKAIVAKEKIAALFA